MTFLEAANINSTIVLEGIDGIWKYKFASGQANERGISIMSMVAFLNIEENKLYTNMKIQPSWFKQKYYNLFLKSTDIRGAFSEAEQFDNKTFVSTFSKLPLGTLGLMSFPSYFSIYVLPEAPLKYFDLDYEKRVKITPFEETSNLVLFEDVEPVLLTVNSEQNLFKASKNDFIVSIHRIERRPYMKCVRKMPSL